MDEQAFEQELRRLNPGRDDIKVKFVGGMPMLEYNNKLGMPKMPRPERPKPHGT
jgi:hypothetical protein